MSACDAVLVGPPVSAQPGGALDDEAPQGERDQREADDAGAGGESRHDAT
jgi:hypothetical protein